MRKTLIGLTCVLLLASAMLWGQAVGGTLSGRITSAAGTPVPNAAITVTNVDNNASQKVLTGPDGTFVIAGLPPGTYRMDVETAGYKRTTEQNVELTTAGQTINITLEAGNMNETVEIRASSPAVETFGGQVAMGLNTRPVRELPVEDRNFEQLVGLMPGVTPPVVALPLTTDPASNRFYSTTGQAPFENNYFMDGVLNWEPFRSTAIRVQPEESIEQMNTTTANYTENKGFASGALVSNITRSGTNNWHGSLFEFWSGNVIQSRSFFNTAGNPDPRFVYNQMGGTIGGAIVPDKTFFFGSYEGTFENGGLTQLTTVPTTAALSGNFSAIPGLTLYNPATGINGTGRTALAGNVIPAGAINPTSAAIAGFIPAANLPGLADNYVSNTPFRNDVSKVDARVDQHFTDRTSAYLRYGFSNYYTSQYSPLGPVIGAGTQDRLLAHNAVIDVTHSFGPTLISDIRMGYNRYDQNLFSLGSQSPLASALGTSLSGNSLLGIGIAGMLPIGQAAYIPEHPVENNFDWVWSWQWSTTHHDVKWGVEARRFRVDNFLENTFPGFAFGPNGAALFGPGTTLTTGAPLSQSSAFYNSFASFLLGAPEQVGATNLLTNPTIRQSEYSVWIGDTFHIMPHFTADLGLRYEIFSPLQPMNTGGAAYYDSTTNTFNYAGIGGVSMNNTAYNTRNVAPRIGLAYRPMARTVIRAGYAIEYFQSPYALSGFMTPMSGTVTGVPGTYTAAPITGTFGPTVATTTPVSTTLVNGTSAGNLPVAIVPRSIPQPYVQTFNAQVQQDFYWSTVLSVGYVGALGRKLTGIEELNAAAPGTGVAGLPFLAPFDRTASTLYYDNGFTSNYNALQASLSKRFSHGLSFLASYTWSKAQGYTTANEMVLNPGNPSLDYGPLAYDHTNVLSISHMFELPWGKKSNSMMAHILGGWELNGIFSWATGTPLTVTADPLACACPGNTVLASLIPGTSPYTSGGTAYLNPAAFSTVPGASYGNLSPGSLRGPSFANYNLSLFKTFHVHEHYIAEIRGEAYNLTNSTNFSNPVTNLNAPDFGQQVSTINGGLGRQFNLALRLLF